MSAVVDRARRLSRRRALVAGGVVALAFLLYAWLAPAYDLDRVNPRFRVLARYDATIGYCGGVFDAVESSTLGSGTPNGVRLSFTFATRAFDSGGWTDSFRPNISAVSVESLVDLNVVPGRTPPVRRGITLTDDDRAWLAEWVRTTRQSDGGHPAMLPERTVNGANRSPFRQFVWDVFHDPRWAWEQLKRKFS